MGPAWGRQTGAVLVFSLASGSVWAGCLPSLSLSFLTYKWAEGPPSLALVWTRTEEVTGRGLAQAGPVPCRRSTFVEPDTAGSRALASSDGRESPAGAMSPRCHVRTTSGGFEGRQTRGAPQAGRREERLPLCPNSTQGGPGPIFGKRRGRRERQNEKEPDRNQLHRQRREGRGDQGLRGEREARRVAGRAEA